MPLYMSITTKSGSQIKGDATSENYKKWIVVDSCEFQITLDIDTHGGDSSTSTPKPQLHPVQIKKRVDSASPRLMRAMVDKEELSEVKVDVCTEDFRCLFRYVLKGDVRLKDYSFSASGDGGHPGDDLTLTYTEVELHETSYDDENAISGQHRASYRRPKTTA